jgi:hypothetical protein
MPAGRVERDAAPFSEPWRHGRELTTRKTSRTYFTGDPSADYKSRQGCERPYMESDVATLYCR